MIKKKRISTWLTVAIIIIVSAGFIWLNNPFVRLAGQEKKLMASLIVVSICLGILLFDALFVRLWDWLVSLSFIQRFKVLTGMKPEQPEYEQNNNRRYEVVKEIRTEMRHLYGRRWGRKTRILLVTGTVSDVEQLTPGLTGQLWQEDRGTLLLWGGDLSTPADSAWLTALRKLRRRPVDGLVWATSAFDQLSAPGLEQPLPVPSDSTMDFLSHAISIRMEALGWQLPLYVWSLHPRAGKPEGRITQATGCLLPAGCRTEGLAEQLSALTPDLTSQGLQQTCGEVKHNFLLTLADQLIREPESVTAPLSVILNPYRPLLLAGVVFSQPSAGAERAVPHHWGMDKRWDALPESVRTLPAGLRPYKPGIPWRRVMASVVALTMVGWAAWMGIAYVTNRSQIADALYR